MAIWRPYDDTVRHAVKADIINIRAIPTKQTVIFEARTRLPNSKLLHGAPFVASSLPIIYIYIVLVSPENATVP